MGARWHLGCGLGAAGLAGVLLVAFGEPAVRPAWALAALAVAGVIGWLALRGGHAPRYAVQSLWATAAILTLALSGGVQGPFGVLALAPVLAAAALGGVWAWGLALSVLAVALGTALSGAFDWPSWLGEVGRASSLGAWPALLAVIAAALAAAAARRPGEARERPPERIAPTPAGAVAPAPARSDVFLSELSAGLERERDEAAAARRTAEAALAEAEEGRRAARAVLQVTVEGRDAALQRLREADYARNMATAERDHVQAQLAEVAAALDAAKAGRSEAEAGRSRAEDAAAARARFLANMSHELRTPLNAIMGFSDIMQQRLFGPLSDKYGEYAGLIHDSGRHLLDLINDVLDMAKVESGRFELHRERFDGREPIEAAVKLMRRQAEEAGVSLRAVLPSGEVEVDADRRAIKQIALNLLSNALKFTPPGGEVTVIAGPREQAFELAVSDDGTGIAPEDLERLGRPFEQAGDSDARAQGTGLGLSLVKAMAELHGGSTMIESTLGQGTAVTVSLPVLANARAGAEAQALDPAPNAPRATVVPLTTR